MPEVVVCVLDEEPHERTSSCVTPIEVGDEHQASVQPERED